MFKKGPKGDRPARKSSRPFSKDNKKTFSRDDRDADRKPFKRAPREEKGERPARKSSRPFARNIEKPFSRNRDSDSKPFGRDRDADRKPFSRAPREEGAERPARKSSRPFARDTEKPFSRNRDSESKPFGRDGDADRKPFSRAPREEGAERPARKSSRPFARDTEKPFSRNRDNDSKPFGRDRDTDRKPYSRAPREEGAERPARKSSRPFARDSESLPFKREPRKRQIDERKAFDPNSDLINQEKPDYLEAETPRARQSFKRDTERPYSRGGDRPFKRDEHPGAIKKLSRKENVIIDKDLRIRLNRYIANAGVCSRREADELIAAGAVSVNGKVITEMGYRLQDGDKVSYGGETLKREKLVYVLLNKPKDFITTLDDPTQRKTVFDLVKKACKERIYPVGRLDRNTTGLLLLTNDGELTKKLTHPKHGVRKVYHVTLDKPVAKADLEKLAGEGLDLTDGHVIPDVVSYVGDNKKEVGIEIHSGRNRIVRRMFEHLGYDVVKLDRVVFAGLTKKDLPRGDYRMLTEKEVSFLKMLG